MGRRGLLLLLLTTLLLLGGAWLLITLRDWHSRQPLLTTGLENYNAPTQNRMFQALLLRRFPIGSSEAALADELVTEGFAPMGRDDERKWRGAGNWRRVGESCASRATVTWTADVQGGRIETIEGWAHICPPGTGAARQEVHR
ncbi:hypothetical protein BH10PSE14_BH10PSE14_13250 [soil metagenome]|jgi:hypothetical protein